MAWKGLFAPVREAVCRLLERIHNAEQTVGRGGAAASVSSCFLVYGTRGTGKTTVLLNARKAVADPSAFFDSPVDEKDRLFEPARESARALAQQVEWLDVLDAEPLPRGSNLLTALLVRIQNALEKGRSGDTSGAQIEEMRVSALFEEGAEAAHKQIGSLLRDASLMWEDIHEADTRARADRHVAAAQATARFRSRFVETMEMVSVYMARRLRGRSLVLPIDNIDRSSDHLHSIIKLAQLVACRHLWLVLAGDRIDIDSFLQRAYWKELIKVGKGAIVGGRERVTGEDEALCMARRQAAAASAKVIPLSHRIKVDPVDPFEAFASEFPPGGQTLREKLATVSLGAEKDPLWPQTLLDLVKNVDYLEDDVVKRVRAGSRRLSTAAWMALRLPARSLLDLHQLVDSLKEGSGDATEAPAAQVARRMLQHCVEVTDMPEWATKLLLESILGRDHRRRTVLRLSEGRVRSADTHSALAELIVPGGDGDRTTLSLEEVIDVRLCLQHPGEGAEGGGETDSQITLAAEITGWFMLLHDALSFCREPVLFSDPANSLVQVPRNTTEHRVKGSGRAVRFDVQWPSPRLSTFWEADLFRNLWHPYSARRDGPPVELSSTALVARYIDTILQVCFPSERLRFAPRTSLADVLASVESIPRPGEGGLIDLRSWKAGYRREVFELIDARLPLLLLPEVSPATMDPPADSEARARFLSRLPSSSSALAARRELLREPILAAVARATEDRSEQRDLLRAVEEHLRAGVPPSLDLHLDVDLGDEGDDDDEAPRRAPSPRKKPSSASAGTPEPTASRRRSRKP